MAAADSFSGESVYTEWTELLMVTDFVLESRLEELVDALELTDCVEEEAAIVAKIVLLLGNELGCRTDNEAGWEDIFTQRHRLAIADKQFNRGIGN